LHQYSQAQTITQPNIHRLLRLSRRSLITIAGRVEFLDGFFDHGTVFARAFLDAANQFVELALGELQIVIRELRPFLFQLALGDVPVAFDFECIHNDLFCMDGWFLSAVSVTAKVNDIGVPA
jgi:hypothetical protein